MLATEPLTDEVWAQIRRKLADRATFTDERLT
jgi:hypothetical protein